MDFWSAAFTLAFVLFMIFQYSVSYYNREAGLLFDSYPKQKLSLPNDLEGVKPNMSFSVKDQMDCVFACINVPWCRSVNFQTMPLKSGLYFCQLLSSDQFTRRVYLKKNKLYRHYSVKNACQEKPCGIDAGECILQDNRQEYQCICKDGFYGQNCETDLVKVTSSSSNCSYSSSGRNGTIQSPGYPDLYPNNFKCNWTFQTLEPNGKIKITFDTFKLENTKYHDLVDIYDGSSSSATRIGRYHERNKPRTISSTSSHLFITFTTDGSVQEKGFIARYRGFTS